MRQLRTLPLSLGLCLGLFACGSSGPSGVESNSASGGLASAGTGANTTSSGGASSSGGSGINSDLGGETSGGSSSSGGSSLGGSAAKGGNAGATGGASVAANAGPSCPEKSLGAWLPVSSASAPTPRTDEWVIPTDDGMLVWGGLGLNSMGA